MKTIDLKMDRSESMPKEYSPPDYPTLTIDSKEDHGLPDEGTATVTFKKVRSSNSEDEDGGAHYSCTIEVQNITNIKAGAGEAEEGEADAETPVEDAADETPAPPKGKRGAGVSKVLAGGEDGEY